jgi:hypothetical protein
MPSDRLSTGRRTGGPSRRQLLATLGAVSLTSTAGCSGLLTGSDSGNTQSSEVSVENGTSSRAEIAVRLVDSADETLFSRVFSLAPESMASRGALDTTPSNIYAFTADGVSRTWAYAPDLPPDFECTPKDVGLTLTPDGTIEPWYDC